MPDINKFKSAVVIEDPAEIRRHLESVREKAGRAGELRSGGPKDEHVVSEKLVGQAVLKQDVPSGEALQSLADAAGIPWLPEYEGRAIPYWASDERVDGMGDIVKQNWHFDEFEKNPVMPYSHQWSQPPVANALVYEVRDRKDKDYKGPALHILGLFALRDQWEWADTIFRLVKSGFLVGGSVGFYSKKVIHIEDEAERSELGLGRWGVILDENHLLEFSPTTLPANAGAHTVLSRAKKDGLLLPGDFQLIREIDRARIAHTSRSNDEWRTADDHWLQLAKTLFPAQRKELVPHKELDESMIEKTEPEIPVTEDPRSLDEKVDRVLTLLEDLMVSHGVRLDDLQSEVEELKQLLSQRAESHTDIAPDGDDTSGLESVGADRLRGLLSKLEGLGTGSGAQATAATS